MRTILILSLFLISTGFVFCRSYYIDFQDGNDNNDGLSTLTPLKSLTAIQNLLVPGESILFKSRTLYEKSLDLHDFRSEVAPIVITSYGPGRAIISAGQSYGLYMSNCSNIVVENLIFSGSGRLSGNTENGVVIEYCEAFENGWDMSRKGNGPVGIWAWHADHVIIQHCISYDNEGAGFGIFEYSGASQWNNNTLRYNISINDGSKNGNTCVMFWNGTGNKELLRDSYIYNNVFYNDRTGVTGVMYLDGYHLNILFTNNIFLTDGPALKGATANSEYLGNVYWNMGKSFYLESYSSFKTWVDATGHEMLGDSVAGMNLFI